MEDIALWVVGWTVICLIVFFIGHVFYCRIVGQPPNQSPQKALVRILLGFNFVLLIGMLAIVIVNNASLLGAITSLGYSLILFNCAGYAYFHVFNMSETARRIRILLHLYQHGSMTDREIAELYSPTNMVQVRLARLQKMGVLSRKQDGLFVVSSLFFLGLARFFHFFRKLLGFR